MLCFANRAADAGGEEAREFLQAAQPQEKFLPASLIFYGFIMLPTFCSFVDAIKSPNQRKSCDIVSVVVCAFGVATGTKQ